MVSSNKFYLMTYNFPKQPRAFLFQFLQDIFDALFAILMESPDKYGKLVFDDLVCLCDSRNQF